MKKDPKELLSLSMGSDLHEEWRSSRLLEDGTYEPRIKTTNDAEWINAHGTDQVDIANCTFAELPKDWQYENLEAARVAVEQSYDFALQHGSRIDNIEAFSSNVHDAWLERNTWAAGGDLDKPYAELPEEEKAKDRAQILQAIEKIETYPQSELEGLSKSEIKEVISMSMGSDLHEEWRSSRLLEDGSYEPRIKTTNDAEWINAHGTDQVDIANCTFAELPKDWQYENLEAARVAVNQAYDYTVEVEKFSSNVHDAWLERNTWAAGGDLDKPYAELPEEEKAKDRAQVLQAIDVVDGFAKGEISLDAISRQFDKEAVQDWNKVIDSDVDLGKKDVDYLNQIDANGLTARDAVEARGDLVTLSDLMDKGALTADEVAKEAVKEIEAIKNKENDNGNEFDD